MRHLAFLSFFACLMLAVPAMAGVISYTDGRGSWTSTQCQMPQQPSGLNRNAEAPANDLNSQVAMHNAYAAQVQEYMACISNEAQRDSEASSAMITRAAQGMIQQSQSSAMSSASFIQHNAMSGE